MPVIEFTRTISLLDRDYENYLGRYDGRIIDTETKELMGRAIAYVFDAEAALADGYLAFDVLDGVTASTVPFVELFSDVVPDSYSKRVLRVLGDDMVVSNRTLIIDRLEVLPKFRGRGIGMACLLLIVRHLGMGCRIATLKPFPLQNELEPFDAEEVEWRGRLDLGSFPKQPSRATRKLKEYYGRLGFVPIPRTETMVLDLERNLPTLEGIGFTDL